MVPCLTVNGNGLVREAGWEVLYVLSGLVVMYMPLHVLLLAEAKSLIVKKLAVFLAHKLLLHCKQF